MCIRDSYLVIAIDYNYKGSAMNGYVSLIP